jgi:hypothetical protein
MLAINQMPSPNVAMIATARAFDVIYIDLEHNSTSLETAAGICVATLGVGITLIARVTSHDTGYILSAGRAKPKRLRELKLSRPSACADMGRSCRPVTEPRGPGRDDGASTQ